MKSNCWKQWESLIATLFISCSISVRCYFLVCQGNMLSLGYKLINHHNYLFAMKVCQIFFHSIFVSDALKFHAVSHCKTKAWAVTYVVDSWSEVECLILYEVMLDFKLSVFKIWEAVFSVIRQFGLSLHLRYRDLLSLLESLWNKYMTVFCSKTKQKQTNNGVEWGQKTEGSG